MTDKERLHWFPFEPKAWLDLRVLRMSLEAQGAYIRILCHMWMDSEDQSSITSDTVILGRILSVSRTVMRRIETELMPEADPIFRIISSPGGERWQSARLAEEKDAATKKHEAMKLRGQKGAEARWGSRRKAMAGASPSDTQGNTDAMLADAQLQLQLQKELKEKEQLNGVPLLSISGEEGSQQQRTKGSGDDRLSAIRETADLLGLSSGEDDRQDSAYLELTKNAATPNRAEVRVRYCNAWAARWGHARVEEVLRSPQARGLSVIDLEDRFFRGEPEEDVSSLVDRALGGGG